MKSPIYTGPRQTIPVKTAKATDSKPATFKDVDLVPGKPLTIDPETELFASLKAAGFVSEAEAAKEPATPAKTRGATTTENKE